MFCAKVSLWQTVCKNAYVPLFRCAKASLYKASVCKNFLHCAKASVCKGAFGTNYFLRIIPTKRQFFDIFSEFFLAFSRVYLQRSFVVEIRRATLWSGARGWGHSDPEDAVRVRQGTLRSRACSCCCCCCCCCWCCCSCCCSCSCSCSCSSCCCCCCCWCCCSCCCSCSWSCSCSCSCSCCCCWCCYRCCRCYRCCCWSCCCCCCCCCCWLLLLLLLLLVVVGATT